MQAYIWWTGPPRLSALSFKDSDAIMDQQVRMDLTTKAIGGF